MKTLLDIMPSFTLHKPCQTCVKEECPTAKNCKDGSSCFEDMECVIEYCKTSPPPTSGAYASDVYNCVKVVGYCDVGNYRTPVHLRSPFTESRERLS